MVSSDDNLGDFELNESHSLSAGQGKIRTGSNSGKGQSASFIDDDEDDIEILGDRTKFINR